MAHWELWYADERGNRLELLNRVTAIDLALVYGDVGAAVVKLPLDGRLYQQARPDALLQMYRASASENLQLLAVCFSRRWVYRRLEKGLGQLDIGAALPDELLARRIVAYAAGSSQAAKSGAADDMMKAVVNENLGSGAAAGRDVSALGLAVQGNLTAGPSISKAFAWQKVLSTLQGIQAASKSAGNEVFFAVRPLTPATFQFETYTGQPGRDRGPGSARPMVFGSAWGNLVNPVYLEDYGEEENYIYAGGRGEGEERVIQEAGDAARMAASAWNRREGFTNATNAELPATVLAAARDRLARKRPVFEFTGDIVPTLATPFGGMNGWQEGDRVTISEFGRQLAAIIRSVRIQVDGHGFEQLTARVEATGTL